MRLLRSSALLALLGAAAPALAAPATALRSLQWSAEPAVLVPIVLSTLWYLAGFARLARLHTTVPLYRPKQALCFLAGELTLVLALLSPLDDLADQLFSAHMLQHMLLLMAAPPLLVWGRPAMAFLWAFGPAGRKRLGKAWQALGLTHGINGLMHPLLVWVLFCGVFIVWHFPDPYQWALHDETVHTVEHISFVATALMFWTIVIEPSGRRRLDYGATLLFILTAAVLSSLPGAIITLAAMPLYPDYAAGTQRWGLSLVQDQQLAGLLMWIPGGMVYLVAAGAVILKWLEFDDSLRPGRIVRSKLEARKAPRQLANLRGEEPTATSARLRQPVGGNATSVALLVGLGGLLLALTGCGSGNAASIASSIGDPHRGAVLIRAAGCGSCHVVPGINDATGLVGPPLQQMGRRIYIAGLLRNTPSNMIRWLRSPESIVPGNAMPDMGLTEDQARDITAYLYTLQ